MKASFLAIAIAAAFSVPVAFAQGSTTPAKPAMNMDMGKPGQGAMPGMNMDADKRAGEMQDNMDNMQRQMDKIAITTDPKERQKLMQTHMETMQQNMKAMREMDSSMRQGGSSPTTMGNKGNNGKKGNMPNADMQKRQDMSDKRMDMMQEMMNQMMQRDKAMAPMGHM